MDVDPYRLPARFALPVCGAAGGPVLAQDNVLITPRSVAVEHDAHGIAARSEEIAVEDFAGVAIRIERTGEGPQAFVISVNLHHDKPDLCIPVHMAFDMADVGARWQSWGRALRLPLLLPDPDGGWREPEAMPGRLVLAPAAPRHPRLALKARRSLISAVREVGRSDGLAVIAGAEIIART